MCGCRASKIGVPLANLPQPTRPSPPGGPLCARDRCHIPAGPGRQDPAAGQWGSMHRRAQAVGPQCANEPQQQATKSGGRRDTFGRRPAGPDSLTRSGRRRPAGHNAPTCPGCSHPIPAGDEILPRCTDGRAERRRQAPGLPAGDDAALMLPADMKPPCQPLVVASSKVFEASAFRRSSRLETHHFSVKGSPVMTQSSSFKSFTFELKSC